MRLGAVGLGREVGAAGHCRPAVFNAANEECVAAFLAGDLPFPAIVDTVAAVVDQAPEFGVPGTVEDVLTAERWARERARQLCSAARKGR